VKKAFLVSKRSLEYVKDELNYIYAKCNNGGGG